MYDCIFHFALLFRNGLLFSSGFTREAWYTSLRTTFSWTAIYNPVEHRRACHTELVTSQRICLLRELRMFPSHVKARVSFAFLSFMTTTYWSLSSVQSIGLRISMRLCPGGLLAVHRSRFIFGVDCTWFYAYAMQFLAFLQTLLATCGQLNVFACCHTICVFQGVTPQQGSSGGIGGKFKALKVQLAWQLHQWTLYRPQVCCTLAVCLSTVWPTFYVARLQKASVNWCCNTTVILGQLYFSQCHFLEGPGLSCAHRLFLRGV